MNCRAEIVEPVAVGLVEKEHRGERAKADIVEGHAGEQRGFDLHRAVLAGRDVEPVGARDAGAVHQRVDDDVFLTRRRGFEPKLDEIGEFFAHRVGGFERQATG